jgi:hypothetical protein
MHVLTKFTAHSPDLRIRCDAVGCCLYTTPWWDFDCHFAARHGPCVNSAQLGNEIIRRWRVHSIAVHVASRHRNNCIEFDRARGVRVVAEKAA